MLAIERTGSPIWNPVAAQNFIEREVGSAATVLRMRCMSGAGHRPSRIAPLRLRGRSSQIGASPCGRGPLRERVAREGLEFQTMIVSDSAPLNGLVSSMLESGRAIRCMRDPTRGGVATVINELAKSSGFEIVIDETAVPMRDGVRAACELLGLDPLYAACEGRLVAIVDGTDAAQVLAAMSDHPLGSGSCRIGTVTRSGAPRVLLRTAFGTTRLLDVLAGGVPPSPPRSLRIGEILRAHFGRSIDNCLPAKLF